MAVAEGTGSVVLSFDTGNETSIYLYIYGSRTTAAVQQKRYENVQLEMGLVQTPYEPRNDDYLIMEETLIGFWGSTEVLTVKGTEASKLKKWGSFTADGSKTYSCTDYEGYKTFSVTNFDYDALSAGGCIGTDQSGNPIGTIFPSGAVGRAIVTTSGSVATFYTNIADSVTGFGETYSPSLGEMQAFFRGWRMNNGTFGTPYNGTGTKTWTRWDATSNTGAVTTLPAGTGGTNFTPIQVYYQLHPSKYYSVPVKIEGSLSNHPGYNTYTLNEGVVIKNRVNPKLDVGFYYIISGSSYWGTARPTYTMLTPLKVYRDGQYDSGWIPGTFLMRLPQASYVTTSLYDISYIPWDKYLFTSPLISATVEYDTSSKEVQDQLVQRVSDIETRLTTHDYILSYLASRVLLIG
jgi:hypothetical protein